MSVAAGRYQLANAFKSLKQEWEATDNVWRDIVRQDFAEAYWEPLAVRIGAVLTAMDRLEQEIAQMRHDCGTSESFE